MKTTVEKQYREEGAESSRKSETHQKKRSPALRAGLVDESVVNRVSGDMCHSIDNKGLDTSLSRRNVVCDMLTF